jgi:RNA 2',3'-cyclic 3'-phosphodiesterase
LPAITALRTIGRMRTIRSFIAISLPAAVQDVLGAVTEELAPRVPGRAVTWVRPESMHLTLRFLGDTPLERLDALSALLDTVAAQHQPFTLHLAQLGAFPDERRPRVIWVGLAGDVDDAAALQRDLDAALIPLGWQPEGKPFSPHLTLGRVKRDHDKIRLPWGRSVVPASFDVGEIHLIESQLRSQGSLYIVRHSSTLHAGERAAP